MIGGVLCLALALGLAAAFAALPSGQLVAPGRALLLFLALLPATLVPGLALAIASAPGFLRQAARGGCCGTAALLAHLGVGLALSVGTAALCLAALGACNAGCGAPLAPPGPVLYLLRADAPGQVWLIGLWLVPLVPAMLHAAAFGQTAAAQLMTATARRRTGRRWHPVLRDLARCAGATLVPVLIGAGLLAALSGPAGAALVAALELVAHRTEVLLRAVRPG